jgi:cobalt-precorrin-5B (C1)-methyltransferase
MQNTMICQLTTGDCVAAAAHAAAANLIFRIRTDIVTIAHPAGTVSVAVRRDDANCDDITSTYVAQMSGGVAPDIREKADIRVSVSYISDFSTIQDRAFIDIRYGNLFMQAGEGIGTASADKPGIRSGEALIDKEVRRMAFETVADVCSVSDGCQLLVITVSCPDGMLIAAKQAMGQNAFAGGIAIIGSYGKISKIHQRDITASIDHQINKQVKNGVKSVLVAPGTYCADKINEQLHVPLKTAVFCYNYPGQAIDTCVEKQVENVLLVGNVGKLIKLAAGITNTNSYASDGRREIFASHTALVGGTAAQVRTVMGCINCDEILSLLDSWGLRDKVMESIMGAIDEYLKVRTDRRLRVAVALFSEQFGLLGQTSDTKNVLVKVSQEQFALSLKLK